MNSQVGRLVYYLSADKMSEIKDGMLGFRIVARPSSGFSYYRAAEFRSENHLLGEIFNANETVYIDIELHRYVDENVFRLDSASERRVNFKRIKPSGKVIKND